MKTPSSSMSRPPRRAYDEVAAHPNQQSTRTHHARDPAPNPRGWCCAGLRGATGATVLLAPDGQSALNLAAARLRHIACTKWSMKCYMNMNLLNQQSMTA
jgi:hypothetical protein